MRTFVNKKEIKGSKYSGSYKIFDKMWKRYNLRERKPGSLLDSYFEQLRVKELIRLFKGRKTIINIGCGSGRWSLPFLKLGFVVTNFDISQHALNVTKERTSHFETNYVRGNVYALPFKDNFFDIVMSFGLLEHFMDVVDPISEMVRILKPGGLFLSDVITKRISVQLLQEWINFFLYLLFQIVRLDFKKIRNSIWFIHKDYFENSLPDSEYLKAMETSGLTKVNITGIRCFPIVMLPFFIERIYLPIFKLFRFLWEDFDRRNTRFSKIWGAIWELRGIKQQ